MDLERIWLQCPEDAGDEGRTWCSDQMGEDDTQYVRKDLYIALEAERDKYLSDVQSRDGLLTGAFDWEQELREEIRKTNKLLDAIQAEIDKVENKQFGLSKTERRLRAILNIKGVLSERTGDMDAKSEEMIKVMEGGGKNGND